jgi:hypothetical protein
MWWAIGIGGVFLYVLVAVTLGLTTLRNGHGWMFIFGFPFPLFWLIGAFMQPTERAAAA